MTDELERALSPHLIRREPARQEPYFSIREAPLFELARRWSLPPAALMARCLERDIWPERFRANRGAFTAQDQARLLESTVAVIGAGGLGGMVCLLLARFGVGRLIICDHDVFDESNLNRQMLSGMTRLNRNKAECAAEEIRNINPAVETVVHAVRAESRNLEDILGPARVVVDCLDNMETRYLVEKAARRLGIPFIHGAVAGLEGMLMTVLPEDPGLEGLYGPTAAGKEDSAEAYLGVSTVIPAVLASLQVNEAVHLLLGRPAPAQGKMLYIDLTLPAIESNELF